jgi:hypothetical protein
MLMTREGNPLRGGGGSLLGQVVGCGALGSGRAGDQEVSNPLSRQQQPTGLLRPHPRQKRVSWGTARRLARSALPRIGMSPSGRSLPSPHSATRRHPTKKSLGIRSDSTCPCTDCSVQVCLQKGPLSSMFPGQRTWITSGPPGRPSCP